jgi:hypothetical protein
MKGKLQCQDRKWYISFDEKELKVHPVDSAVLDTFAAHLCETEIEFEIVDEFSHPEFYEGVSLYQGEVYAKLVDNDLMWEIIFYEYRTSYRNHYLTLENWLKSRFTIPKRITHV